MGGGGGGLSAFSRFNQWTGGGGGGRAVRFRPIQPVGGGGEGCCSLSADLTSEGGGGGADVSFRPIQSMRCPHYQQIQPVDGGCFQPIQPVGVHMYVNTGRGGGGGGGGGAPFSPEGGGHGPPGDTHAGGWMNVDEWMDRCMVQHGHILYLCMYMHTNTPLWLTFSSWFYFLLQC